MRSAAGVLPLLLAGCSLLAPDESERLLKGESDEPITLANLEQRTRDFADRYVHLLADACEHLKKTAESPELRQRAHLLKLRSAASAFDIVTGPHPLKELLDLIVQVELQALIFVDDREAGRVFGPRNAERLEKALLDARREIWTLAARAMTRDKMDELKALVRQWRREHADVETAAFVRFDQFLQTPGQSAAAAILSGFGILDLSRLNPFDPAARSVDRATVLADDAFYLAKRLPMLLDWEAEAAIGAIGSSPTLTTLVASIERIAARLDRLPEDVARERDAIFKSLDEKRETVGSTLRDLRDTIEAGRALSTDLARAGAAFEKTFHELNLLAHPPKKPGEVEEKDPAKKARPFDINEYARAAKVLADTADRLQGVFAEARSLADSPALLSRFGEAEKMAARSVDRAASIARGLLAWAVAGGLLLILAACLGLLGYRLAVDRLRKK